MFELRINPLEHFCNLLTVIAMAAMQMTSMGLPAIRCANSTSNAIRKGAVSANISDVFLLSLSLSLDRYFLCVICYHGNPCNEEVPLGCVCFSSVCVCTEPWIVLFSVCASLYGSDEKQCQHFRYTSNVDRVYICLSSRTK